MKHELLKRLYYKFLRGLSKITKPIKSGLRTSQQSATQMTKTALQRVTLILSLIAMVKTRVIWQSAASRAASHRPTRRTALPSHPQQPAATRSVQFSNRRNLLVHTRPSCWPVASWSISCAIGTNLRCSAPMMVMVISRKSRVADSPSFTALFRRIWAAIPGDQPTATNK